MKSMSLNHLVFALGLPLFGALVACSGGQTQGGDDSGESQTALKKRAAEASADGNVQGDVCGANGWYGDGVCDTFCQDADVRDCGVGCGGVVCALFIEESNGYCSRKADDPCLAQDPDCAGDSVPPYPVYPGDEPVACAAIAEVADGVCKRDDSDPCRFQDPDCPVSGGGSGTPSDPGMGGGSEPGNPDEPPNICKAIAEAADGVCSREPNDPCLGLDPDCVPDVACAEYIELSDGVCKRDPADPCIFQDPDCHVK